MCDEFITRPLILVDKCSVAADILPRLWQGANMSLFDTFSLTGLSTFFASCEPSKYDVAVNFQLK